MAEANLAQAELNVKRQRTLFEEQITSDAALETAESAYDVAQAGVRQARAAMETVGRQVEDTRIVSPLNGFVTVRRVEVGTFVSPPTPAYTVVAMDPMEVLLSVTDRDISRVRVGAAVDVFVDALEGSSLSGRVSEVSVAADRMSGSFPVKIRVSNRDGTLRDGMTVRVAVHVGRRENAIVVSPDALIERGGQWFAFVVHDSAAESRRVTPGAWVAGGVIIEEGLSAGDRLVVKGQAYLDTGTRVRVEEVGS